MLLCYLRCVPHESHSSSTWRRRAFIRHPGIEFDTVAPLQVCKAGLARMRKIWLSRHGESMYNTLARLGGDSTLSPRGEVYAYKLPDVLVDRVPLVGHLLIATPWP